MTQALEDRIGGLLLVGFDGTTLSSETASFIAETSGAILFSRNIATRTQVRALVETLQESARESGRMPLLVAVDQEGGPVDRLGSVGTPTPAAMALGAAGDTALTRSTYRLIGEELASLGINLDLAPVADLNTNAANLEIGLRSFGDQPDVVAQHVAAAVHGLRDAGIAATVKHFPGHGDTEVDSHNALPIVTHDVELLRRRELVPFRAGIEAGADVVMTAHIALPKLDPDNSATLSAAVLRDLLRRDMQYVGIVCTDDMEMQAIAGRYPLDEAAVLAVAAGADLVLFSHSLTAARSAQAALRRALASGRLDAAQVAASLARVEALRNRTRSASTTPNVDTAAHIKETSDAARRAIAIVRRTSAAPPLQLEPSARVFVANFSNNPADRVSGARAQSAFGKALAAGGARITEQVRSLDPAGQEYKQLLMAAGAADAFIAITRRAFRHPLQIQAVADLAMFGKPIVVVAALEPYDAVVLPAEVAVVASFGDGDAALTAAADVVLGKADAPGRLPVTLPANLNAAEVHAADARTASAT